MWENKYFEVGDVIVPFKCMEEMIRILMWTDIIPNSLDDKYTWPSFPRELIKRHFSYFHIEF